MLIQMYIYQVRCDSINCAYQEKVTVAGSLEGSNFYVEGWSMETEHIRGGPTRRHFCPKCTEDKKIKKKLEA